MKWMGHPALGDRNCAGEWSVPIVAFLLKVLETGLYNFHIYLGLSVFF